MLFVFCSIAFLTVSSALLGPLCVPESQRDQFYTHDSQTRAWLFITVPPIALSLIWGLLLTIWKSIVWWLIKRKLTRYPPSSIYHN